MTGRSAEERAVVHMMQRRGEQKIVDAIGAYFHHPTMGFGPEVELDQNKAWGEAHLQKTLDGMVYFDEVLQDSPFIAGENYSMQTLPFSRVLTFQRPIQRLWYLKH